jgi:UDP-glucose 4-epimerase
MSMPKLKHDTYIVTGGVGFIGSHICEEIVAQGKRVICIDSLVAGNMENVEYLIDKPNFVFLAADIVMDRDLGWIDKVMTTGGMFPHQKVDVVFHNAASKCTVCAENPRKDLMVNAYGTLAIARLCAKHGAKMVHASTGSVYGNSDSYLPLTEDMPFNPVSYYGASKATAEKFLGMMATYGEHLDYSILRYFHVFGPRQNSTDTGGVVPIFIRNCLIGPPMTIYGSGKQTRSFTWVKDVVRANFLVANKWATGQTYNCASGLTISIRELARMVQDTIDEPHYAAITYDKARPGDIKRFNVSNAKIRDQLGMNFDMDFPARLEETVKWYKARFAN